MTDIKPYEDEEDPEVRSDKPWTIQNVPSLEWALKRTANLYNEKDSLEAAADEAHKRIESRKALLLDRIQRGIAYFEGQIGSYAAENREALLGGSNKKSRSFLFGIIGWRKRAGRLVVVDAEALKAWLTAQPNEVLYRVKIEPEMKALQENFAKTGEVPPGTEYVVEQEKLYIEPADPAEGLVKK